MRTVDLNQMRTQIAEITLDGKTFRVYERNLRQRLLHRKEYDEALKDLQRISKKNNGKATDEYEDRLNRWLLREIQIFIPEFTQQDAEMITSTQREAILSAIFETGNEEPATEKKSPSKAKRRGEKSSE